MQLFADFFATTLAQPAADGAFRYLIVDTAATRPANITRQLGMNGSAIDLLSRQPCAWADCVRPVLLELPSVPATAATCLTSRQMLRHWRYANCFVYVESSHAIETATTMFSARCDALLPEGMHVVMRYFDPRVFQTLLTVLHADQLRAFLSAGTRWARPGRRGELHLTEVGATNEVPTFTAPLPIDEIQQQMLIDAGDTDAMIDLLLEQNNAKLLTMLPSEQYDLIDAALDSAKRHRIERLSDQAAFCSLVLDRGLDFDQREPWPSLLAEVRSGGASFIQLLEHLISSEQQ